MLSRQFDICYQTAQGAKESPATVAATDILLIDKTGFSGPLFSLPNLSARQGSLIVSPSLMSWH
jgi:hypothetical protein